MSETVVVQYVPIDAIERAEQVRHDWRHDDGNARLDELAESIKTKGIINPLTVRPVGGGRYALVAGHRRYVAAKRAGLTSVPVSVTDATSADSWVIQMSENIHRASLSPVDEGRVYSAMHFDEGMSTALIAQIVNRPEWHVRKQIALYGEPVIREALGQRRIGPLAAQKLLTLMQWYGKDESGAFRLYHEPLRLWERLREGATLNDADVHSLYHHYRENSVPHDPDAYTAMLESSAALHRAYHRYVDPDWASAQEAEIERLRSEGWQEFAGWVKDKSPDKPADPPPQVNVFQARQQLAPMFEDIKAALPKRDKPTVAFPRPDPLTALSGRYEPTPGGYYSRNPEHVVVEAPPSRWARQIVAESPSESSPGSLTSATAVDPLPGLVGALSRIPLERLLTYGATNGLSCVELLERVREVPQ